MKYYDIAAFVWPSYTADEPRARMFWREGYGEWQSIKNAKENSDKYKPDWYETWKERKPLWGYVNEANPEVMEMQIECAVSHGVNVFIYDWYWYDGRPFLENCLNDGFLKAKNTEKMKFYLMWANHNVNECWNIDRSDDNLTDKNVIWYGTVSPDEYKRLVDRWIEKYFKLPNYYKIDGKPVFLIYDPRNFINNFGGNLSLARAALDYFREKATEAGLPGLHLQITSWNVAVQNYSGVDGEPCDVSEIYKALGFDSATNYQWVHFQHPGDYAEMTKRAKEEYESITERGMCYFPHVSIGWDNNPRYRKFRPGIVEKNTPEAFEKALRVAKEYADTHELPANLITVNSWNEWTETSYLEPDELYGYGYLEAIKKVFTENN